MNEIVTLQGLRIFMNKFLARMKSIYLEKANMDSTPTSGSSNPVTSDGIYNAISTRVTVSVEPSDGTTTWIEVPTENLIIGDTEPTGQNAIWIEVTK